MSIGMKNVRNTDLNLLVAFDALMSERSVTEAGKRIGLAQPSMSNALTRLRALFDDELFVRTPNGMTPTQIALDAEAHVRAAILAAEDAINVGRIFDPQSYEGEIVLLTHDLNELTVLPDLVGALQSNAPGIRLKTRPLVGMNFADDLDAGHADLALCAARSVPKRFHYEVLYGESFAGIARPDHPIFDGPITLSAFMAAKHAMLSHRLDRKEIVDTWLGEKGLTRDVAVSVSNFATLPPIVIEADLIAILPRRLATKADKELPVRMFELPFDLPTVESKLIWGRGTDRSPISSWFRQLVAEVVGSNDNATR